MQGKIDFKESFKRRMMLLKGMDESVLEGIANRCVCVFVAMSMCVCVCCYESVCVCVCCYEYVCVCVLL